jgi:hypothetical protein
MEVMRISYATCTRRLATYKATPRATHVHRMDKALLLLLLLLFFFLLLVVAVAVAVGCVD